MRTGIQRAAALALALALAALAGAACRSGEKHPPEWQAGEVDVGGETLLWQVTVFALEKQGFPVGTGMDPSALVATSGWKTSLQPFRGKGWREQAQVRYERLGPRRFRVEVRVKKETNEDMVRPLDPSYAKWKPAPDNVDAAKVLLQRIRAWVGGELELSEGALGGRQGPKN